MATEGYRVVAQLAEQRWGLVTTAQAEQAGVSRLQMSRMASSGSLIRVAQGVYRVAGAPELEHEQTFATWLALGGATTGPTPAGVAPVVAAATTATQLHRIGYFWPDGFDFIVPARRSTRLPGVRLRVRHLTPAEVTYAESVPTLTVERTIADLVEQWTDLSLVADLVRDAIEQGKLVAPHQLATHLQPLAKINDFADGRAFTNDLFALAEAVPVGWATSA